MTLEPVEKQASAATITPPTTGPLRRHTHTYDLMRQCIHCGFCLPTCPTYAVLGVEMDSPRGRIYQMQAVAEGRLDISDDFIEHMNCCLGCRACETACPSGVQFGKLIEAAREQIQMETVAQEQAPYLNGSGQQVTISEAQPTVNAIAHRLLRRFFFDVMLPYRFVLALVFAGLKLYQRSGLQQLVRRSGLLDAVNSLPTPFKGQLKVPEELMDAASGPLYSAPLPEITPAPGRRRYRVGFVSGCIMDQVFRDVNEATIRVLAANGCEVVTPVQQNCCGALHVHGGEAAGGRDLARRNIDVFEHFDLDAIIINAAGCGSTLKEYDHLLRDDPMYASRAHEFSTKVKDVSEFLAGIELNQHMGTLDRVIAYHDACHLAHGQKIRQQPRQVLKSIPGLKMVDLKESDWCCGSAGIYNITNQEMAAQLLERKINNIVQTGASTIATGNPGCTMQIALGVRERGLPITVMHPVQLLDEAYRAGGLYELPEADEDEMAKRRIGVLVGATIVAVGVLFLIGRRKRK